MGILERFHGNACLLCIKSSSPPLNPLYVIRWRMILVMLCVLLKNNLYGGNKCCMYFVDLVAESLVS